MEITNKKNKRNINLFAVATMASCMATMLLTNCDVEPKPPPETKNPFVGTWKNYFPVPFSTDTVHYDDFTVIFTETHLTAFRVNSLNDTVYVYDNTEYKVLSDTLELYGYAFIHGEIKLAHYPEFPEVLEHEDYYLYPGKPIVKYWFSKFPPLDLDTSLRINNFYMQYDYIENKFSGGILCM